MHFVGIGHGKQRTGALKMTTAIRFDFQTDNINQEVTKALPEHVFSVDDVSKTVQNTVNENDR